MKGKNGSALGDSTKTVVSKPEHRPFTLTCTELLARTYAGVAPAHSGNVSLIKKVTGRVYKG